MEHEGVGNTNCNLCTLNDPQRVGKEVGKVRNHGRPETIQTKVLLRYARILRRVLETRGHLLLLRNQ